MIGFGLSVVAVLCELLLICLPTVGLVLMTFLLVDYLVSGVVAWRFADLSGCLFTVVFGWFCWFC